ncbi:hypothetical protein FF124_04980 [Martelella lutilitoris]|uniref:Lipoprotein n=1 Tax=Martelella lutilitoris TaxID=2583532 RepID=A0A5C4JW15_9HYPH|nr:hypothetical protein [Martelella lutilitoris]TNB49341.1 hypothetical protein FF124_04980 [Martelella lutilitoris]
MASIFIAAGLLAACSASDVMTVSSTPPAPVNAPAYQTTQSPPPVAAAPQGNVARQNLAAPAAPSYGSQTTASAAATTLDATPGRGRAPSTFGQQAEQLDQPAATAPVQATSAPASAARQITAAPAQSPATAAQRQAAAAPAASEPAAPQQTAALAAVQSVRFLPIIGAPSDKLEPLSARLGDSVRAAGLTIVPTGETTADLSLKGYFSVINEDGHVSVVYVWDVIGTDGLRLHRIQGSEAAPKGGFSGADPWDAVTPDMMADVGQKSVGGLLAWLDSQG